VPPGPSRKPHAWPFAILVTGRYPRGLFDSVVGSGRWALRVTADVSLLVTDPHPSAWAENRPTVHRGDPGPDGTHGPSRCPGDVYTVEWCATSPRRQ
jgi:hypothetical protein